MHLSGRLREDLSGLQGVVGYDVEALGGGGEGDVVLWRDDAGRSSRRGLDGTPPHVPSCPRKCPRLLSPTTGRH